MQQDISQVNNNHPVSHRVKIAVISAIDTTMVSLLLAQITSAQDMGFEVHGLCSKGPNFEKLSSRGIIMHAITITRRISPIKDLTALWNLYRYFKREKIDIVHTHTPKCSLLGQLAAKLAGVPIVINTVHGFYFHENMKPMPRRFYIAIEWFAARLSTMILCQNPEDIETAVNLGFCQRNRIRLLGNGVDLSQFDPERFDLEFKAHKRADIGLPDDAIVVGIIGRLVREKGFLELFQSMQTIMTKHKKVWLLVIGPEQPEKADRISQDTYQQYGIGDRTVALGLREDIPELLACCDIYTLPSWREGFPRSAIEASAMGLPVVATNIRGCRQVVEDGKTGFLTTLYSVEELQEALLKLITNEKLRLALGRRGYEKSRQDFDEGKVCRIVMDTYNKYLQEKIPDKTFTPKNISIEKGHTIENGA